VATASPLRSNDPHRREYVPQRFFRESTWSPPALGSVGATTK
jgi:hypothetical protein